MPAILATAGGLTLDTDGLAWADGRLLGRIDGPPGIEPADGDEDAWEELGRVWAERLREGELDRADDRRQYFLAVGGW